MKRKRKTLRFLTLISAAVLVVSACSSQNAEWKDTTINLGLESYVPDFLSGIMYIPESESESLTIDERCFIKENTECSPLCYKTGENSRFEMRHYGRNMEQGITYSLVYYFDGTQKRLVDWGGDNVFSKFALCDGEHLCYLVSDGTLRVLGMDGGRRDYENFFDNEKINLASDSENMFLFAEGNRILFGRERMPSDGDMIINGEKETITDIVGETEINEEPFVFENSAGKAYWSDKTKYSFYDNFHNVPEYIAQNRKFYEETQVVENNGDLSYCNTRKSESYECLELDGVRLYPTGENEGFAVKTYRYGGIWDPVCYEICRYKNDELKLLAFSGDSNFSYCFMFDGSRLCYIVDGEILRVIDINGRQKDYSGFEKPVFGDAASLSSDDGKTIIIKKWGEQIASITP